MPQEHGITAVQVSYREREEDGRLLRLEIKRLKEETHFLEQDTR